MADFKSFKSLGNSFKGGMQALGSPNLTPVPRYKTILDMDAALHAAGQRYVQHFRNKIEEGDPNWDPLSERTQLNRAYWGVRGGEYAGDNWDKPLNYSQQLKQAFTYDVDALTNKLEVGVRDDVHFSPNGNDAISMVDLLETKEVGTHTEPSRPIIFGEDKDRFENEVVTAFAHFALFGHRTGLVNWKK